MRFDGSGQASMGPRLISRGVNERTRTGEDLLLASMGPRLISRGVGVVIDVAPWCQLLQWGRGSLAAAW